VLISSAWLAPYLLTLLIDQRRGHRTEMLQAFERASERLIAQSPQAIVIVSAHWSVPGSFLVDCGRRHITRIDDPGLGVEVRYDCSGHPALARALIEAGTKARIPLAATARGVDSGVAVPMHLLIPAGGIPVVPLSVAMRPLAECRHWGRVLRDALSQWPERVAFLVGGLLSHNVHAWRFGREVPETQELDQRILNVLECGEWNALQACDADLVSRAQPEAGLRHLELLRGFLAHDAKGEMLCYERGPGVGAVLMEFEVKAAFEASARDPEEAPEQH
jgi:aromatic ring-opening dioxygenase catalytic subunit (LigB family)